MYKLVAKVNNIDITRIALKTKYNKKIPDTSRLVQKKKQKQKQKKQKKYRL